MKVATTQNSEKLEVLPGQAFKQIAEVYQLGGKAPELVTKLNSALTFLEQARLKRLQGEETSAVTLEEWARLEILEVTRDGAIARQKAQSDSANRVFSTILAVPVLVSLSTFGFYAGLRIWRRYEKSQLYEMRIVEKKTEN